MTCEIAKERIVLLAYGELHEDETVELEVHLRTCEACRAEQEALEAFADVMAMELVPEPSPNLLAQSRMQLDEALDEAPADSWVARTRTLLLGSWKHLIAAPALATLLLGVGFLGGNFLNRYQVAHAPKLPSAVVMTNDTQSVVSNVSGIVQTPNSEIVQVNYNRIVPETIQGSLNDPQIRQLLLVGAKNGINNDVRANSVGLLADECKAGRGCDGESSGLRDTLLVSLRYDTNPTVRLRALEGLQRYVGKDSRVRDAVLESLMRDPNADVRSHAISLLEPVQADSSVRQVLHTVSTQDENPFIRNASMQALQGAGGIQ